MSQAGYTFLAALLVTPMLEQLFNLEPGFGVLETLEGFKLNRAKQVRSTSGSPTHSRGRLLTSHSYLSASTGFILDACHAGYSPESTQVTTANPTTRAPRETLRSGANPT